MSGVSRGMQGSAVSAVVDYMHRDGRLVNPSALASGESDLVLASTERHVDRRAAAQVAVDRRAPAQRNALDPILVDPNPLAA